MIQRAAFGVSLMATLVAQTVKNLPAMQETWVQSLGAVPGSGRSHGEGNGNPLQHSCLENPMARGTWWATAHRVTKELDHDLASKHEQHSNSLSNIRRKQNIKPEEAK